MKRGANLPVSRTVYEITTVERVRSTWCVHYNNRSFILTGDIGFALAGNGPILVSDDGRVGQAGTAMPVEHYVAEFEQPDPS